jgi:hypothetical protein
MKTKIALICLFVGLYLQFPAQAQDRLDSLLIDAGSSPDQVNPFDLCYEFKGLLKKACGEVRTNDNFQVIEQGRNLCLISQARTRLQIFIDNYLFKRNRGFSVVLLYDEKKYIYVVDAKGNGGYFKNDERGFLILSSIFMSNERFAPMTKEEIAYLNERLTKALYLTKKLTD